jgi:hypothetical protein
MPINLEPPPNLEQHSVPSSSKTEPHKTEPTEKEPQARAKESRIQSPQDENRSQTSLEKKNLTNDPGPLSDQKTNARQDASHYSQNQQRIDQRGVAPDSHAESIGRRYVARGIDDQIKGRAEIAQGSKDQTSGRHKIAQGIDDQIKGRHETAKGSSDLISGRNDVTLGKHDKQSGSHDIKAGVAEVAEGLHDFSKGRTTDGLKEIVLGAREINKGRGLTAEGSRYVLVGDKLENKARWELHEGQGLEVQGGKEIGQGKRLLDKGNREIIQGTRLFAEGGKEITEGLALQHQAQGTGDGKGTGNGGNHGGHNEGGGSQPNKPFILNNGSTGAFSVVATDKGAEIIDPNGNRVQIKGVNIWAEQQQPEIAKDLASKGVNLVRVSIRGNQGLLPKLSDMQELVKNYNSQGIIVEFTDRGPTGTGVVATGQALQNLKNEYQQLATAFKDKPGVWFGSPNEAGDDKTASNPAAMKAWFNEIKTIDTTIRNAGNHNPYLVNDSDWGAGIALGAKTSAIITAARQLDMMDSNIVVAPHIYNKSANAEATLSAAVSKYEDKLKKPVILEEVGGLAGFQPGAAAADNLGNRGQVAGVVAWTYKKLDENTLYDQNGNLTEWGQKFFYGENNGKL